MPDDKWPIPTLVTRLLSRSRQRGYTARIEVANIEGGIFEIREKADIHERVMALRWLSRTVNQLAKGRTEVYVDHKIHLTSEAD